MYSHIYIYMHILRNVSACHQIGISRWLWMPYFETHILGFSNSFHVRLRSMLIWSFQRYTIISKMKFILNCTILFASSLTTFEYSICSVQFTSHARLSEVDRDLACDRSFRWLSAMVPVYSLLYFCSVRLVLITMHLGSFFSFQYLYSYFRAASI